MNASRAKTFLYHASANPIGGQVTSPVQQDLAPDASSALPQAGGHAVASVDGQAIPHPEGGNIISFDKAQSEVTGKATVDEEGYWTTTVRSVVRGFKLLDVVTADTIEAYIKVRHPHAGGHPLVSFQGSHFDNLRIKNEPVHVQLHLKTLSREAGLQVIPGGGKAAVVDSLAAAASLPWEQDTQVMGAVRAQNTELLAAAKDQAWVQERYNGRTDPKKGRVVCSLVKSLSIGTNGARPYTSYGHIIEVPDVGNIFLGELSVQGGGFRLTMLRAEMGCRADGEMSAASADSDGRSIP